MPAVTNNAELMIAAQRNNIPLVGVFFKDKLPTMIYDGGYIINLANSTDGEGTHWVAIYVERDQHGKQHAVYFDSFGMGLPENVKRFLWAIDESVQYNKKHIQNINSFICGYYVLYFLWYMSRYCRFQESHNIYKRFQQFQNLWSLDVEDNRKLLEQYLECLK